MTTLNDILKRELEGKRFRNEREAYVIRKVGRRFDDTRNTHVIYFDVEYDRKYGMSGVKETRTIQESIHDEKVSPTQLLSLAQRWYKRFFG